MSFDIMDLELPMQETIDRGHVDKWLRGLSNIVPRHVEQKREISQERDLHTAAGMQITILPMNTHLLSYGSHEKITEQRIENLIGFQQLIDSCKKNNVRIDVVNHGRGTIEVSFEPEEAFSGSKIFGRKHGNIVPMLPRYRGNTE